MTEYVTTADALFFHQELIRRYGELATALAIRIDPDAPVTATESGFVPLEGRPRSARTRTMLRHKAEFARFANGTRGPQRPGRISSGNR